MERIENKLDNISEKISSIDVTLAEQNVTLKEHIRRTDLLELIVLPIQTKIHYVEGSLKFIGVLSLICSLFYAIIRLIGR